MGESLMQIKVVDDASTDGDVAALVASLGQGRVQYYRQPVGCLHMLQTLPCAPAEIVVVDNAPSDTSTRDVTAEFADVVYVCEPRPELDIARNTGVRAVRYPGWLLSTTTWWCTLGC